MMRQRVVLVALALIFWLPPGIRAQESAFTIQIAASPSEAEARAVAAESRGRGIEALIVRRAQAGQGTIYRVHVGRFATRGQAERAARDFVRRGLIVAFFVRPSEADEEDGNRLADGERSWSLLGFAPMAAALREAAARPARPARDEIADQVMRLAARSTDAAAIAVRERSTRLMIPIRNREHGYAYNRPRDWRENETNGESLRQEGVNSGEVFIAPDATAFLSSAFRQFKSDFDGNTPLGALTPEVLIEKLLGKLRRLPGVNEARQGGYKVLRKDGVERTDVEIELSFRPTANDPAVAFTGWAVLLRNDAGILELIGVCRRLGPDGAAQRMIEQSLGSASLQTRTEK